MSVREFSEGSNTFCEESVDVSIINSERSFEESKIEVWKELSKRVQILDSEDSQIQQTLVDNVLIVKEPSKQLKERKSAYWKKRVVIWGCLSLFSATLAGFSFAVIGAATSSYYVVLPAIFSCGALGLAIFSGAQMGKWGNNYAETFANLRREAFVQGFDFIINKKQRFLNILNTQEKKGLYFEFFKSLVIQSQSLYTDKDRYNFFEKTMHNSPLLKEAQSYSQLSVFQESLLKPSYEKYLELLYLFNNFKSTKESIKEDFSFQINSKLYKIEEKKQEELDKFPILEKKDLSFSNGPSDDQNHSLSDLVQDQVQPVPSGFELEEKRDSLYPECVPMGLPLEEPPMGLPVEEFPTSTQIEERNQIRKKIIAFFDRKISELTRVKRNYNHRLENIFQQQASRLYYSDFVAIHENGYMELTKQKMEALPGLPSLTSQNMQSSDILKLSLLGVSYQFEIETIFEQALKEVFT